MIDENIRGLIGKAWKDETIDLEPGRSTYLRTLRVGLTVPTSIDRSPAHFRRATPLKEDDFASPIREPSFQVPLSIRTLHLPCSGRKPASPVIMPSEC